MKKYAKKVLCLVLAVLLVSSIAVPAAAVAATGSGRYSQYSYSWTVECAETYGLAEISANGMPAYVKAYAECTVYSQQFNLNFLTRSVEDLDDIPSNYVHTVATAGNTFVYQGSNWTGEITKTFGKFWVANENVVPSVYDYPG